MTAFTQRPLLKRAVVALLVTCASACAKGVPAVDPQAPNQLMVVQKGGATGTVLVTVFGTVRSAGEPIADVPIGVATWEAKVWKRVTTTDSEGRFRFRVRLRPDYYIVLGGLGNFEIVRGLLTVEPSPQEQFIEPYLYVENAKAESLPPSLPQEGLLPRDVPPMPMTTPPPPPPYILPTPGQAEVVSVYYGTNRRPTGNGVYAAGAANPAGLECGIAKVQIPPTHIEGELERPQIWRLEFVEDKERHFIIKQREVIASSDDFYSRLAAGLKASDSEGFLFIHGYNVDFDDAVLRTAQLFKDLHFGGVPILFSWPAQDAWWRYLSAEDQATVAVPYLQEFLRRIAAVGKPKAINVIAHSMGNRVVVNALFGLMQDPEMRKTALFKNLVLAAPDVSLDNFNAVATAVKQAAARVTVYSSNADIPLQLSQRLHRFERLGEAPPLHVPPGIDAVDASAVTRDLLGHSYFSRAGTMLDDLRQLLKDGVPPPRRLQPVTQRGEVQYWRVPR